LPHEYARQRRVVEWVDIDRYQAIYAIVPDFQPLTRRRESTPEHRAVGLRVVGGLPARPNRHGMTADHAPSNDGRGRMARKPATREGFVLFDVTYEDGSQRSNRRVPSDILGGLDGDAPARAVIEEQDRVIAEKSGKPALAVKSIHRSRAKEPPSETKPRRGRESR
jgi:hypothetical protein